MAVDPDILAALATSLSDLNETPAHPIPTGAIAALADIARPGLELRIDLDVSKAIGAPLVTLAAPAYRDGFLAVLTARQRQVAAHLIAGKSNRQIAAALGISVATVKDHVHAILQKTGLPSRSAVIAATRISKAG